MRLFFIALLLVVVLTACRSGTDVVISPFTTDGCSEFPDGTLKQKNLWHDCCTAHDVHYWTGGTFEERMHADLQLRECVSAVGEPAIANLMLAGVRVGGSPWWPTAFRWGYGWPYTNGYRALTSSEKEQVLLQKKRQGLK